MEAIKQIYFQNMNTNYGLKILFEFSSSYLFFDSVSFNVITKSGFQIDLDQWDIIDYPSIENGLYVLDVKEDELTTYFIKFSNEDIMQIYQRIEGLGEWIQDFQIVSRKNLEKYTKVLDYMNESWVENIELKFY
jgi:hypothetical protein